MESNMNVNSFSNGFEHYLSPDVSICNLLIGYLKLTYETHQNITSLQLSLALTVGCFLDDPSIDRSSIQTRILNLQPIPIYS